MHHDTLACWRETGRKAIAENLVVLQDLLRQAEGYEREGDRDMAAVLATVAASHATFKHCGLFASGALERLAWRIARDALRPVPARARPRLPARERVLHVTFAVSPVGGLTRMLVRWIGQDAERSHSIAITDQFRRPIPDAVGRAVARSGGDIYYIDGAPGGTLMRAQRLRQVAAEFDFVVLHIGADDMAAILAFNAHPTSPPVLYVNHADHLFWLGVSACDVVVNLRCSGADLSLRRRRVPPERNGLLPTLLQPAERTISRTAAKRALGLAENALVLLSVARPCKYGTVGGVTYADAHAPVLARHPDAVLVVVGAGQRPDWAAATERCGGRIRCFDARPDVETFFQAADIYVDSFPFVSITSLLEAGSYGVPLVSRFPYTDASRILGADMPGLNERLLVARTLEAYRQALGELIGDEAARARRGALLRDAIHRHHTAVAWQERLEVIYGTARRVGRPLPPADDSAADIPSDVEPDTYIQSIFGNLDPDPRAQAELTLRLQLGVMPMRHRVHFWRRMRAERSLPNQRLHRQLLHLVPEWIWRRLGRASRVLLDGR